jgi:transposase
MVKAGGRVFHQTLSCLKSGLPYRGYGVDWIRAFISQHRAWANIPSRRNRKEALCFSPYLYSARNLVERSFNKIKQSRCVATRYDNFTANYLAFISACLELGQKLVTA